MLCSFGFASLIQMNGCDSTHPYDGPLPSRSLVDHTEWVALPATESPFEVDAQAEVCAMNKNAVYEDLGGEPTFAVKTMGCDYATVSQPSRSMVRAGENIAIRVWHFSLTSPSGGTAVLAIHFGSYRVWDAHIPIPTPGGLHPLNWVAPADIPENTPIIFHVSNHGQNEYNFVEMTAGKSLNIN